MGNTEYWFVTLSLHEIATRLRIPDFKDGLDAAERRQRKLVKSRVPEISQYILCNPKDFFFAPLVVCVAEGLSFIPSENEPTHGKLILESGETLTILDGQHRYAGIVRSMRDYSPGVDSASLQSDRIGVMIIRDTGIRRMQQVFSDLNRNAVKPPKPINILFDHRDLVGELTIQLMESGRVPYLSNRWVDRERSAIPKSSDKLFSISSLYDANGLLTLGSVSEENFEEQLETVEIFWGALLSNLPHLPDLLASDSHAAASHARNEFIYSLGPTMWAFGYMGRRLMDSTNEWLSRLDGVAEIDWKKSNPEWQTIVLSGSTVLNKLQPRKDLAIYLMHKLRVPLNQLESDTLDKVKHRIEKNSHGTPALQL